MTDYRSMYDGKYLGSWNLVDADGNKRDCVVTISGVQAGEVVMEGGVKNKRPIISFEGKPLPMICNKTNGKAIAGMYGTDTKAWVGKRITLYSTTTQVGGQEKDCIRVRPTIPVAPAKASAA
jgi:hypothetical protein